MPIGTKRQDVVAGQRKMPGRASDSNRRRLVRKVA